MCFDQRRCQRLDFRHRRQRLARTRSRRGQARQQCRDQGIGLLAGDGPHQAHLGPAGSDHAVVHLPHVSHADLRQRFLGHLVAVRMGAVDRLGVGPAGHGAGAGIGLADCGGHALALALPDIVGKGRLAQLPCGQLNRFGQDVGEAQCPKRETHPVRARAAVETGAEVGPGLAQLVLVHGLRIGRRAGGAFPGRQDALGGHAGGGAGQTRLLRRVAPATRVEVDAHIEHRQRRAFDEVDLGSAGLRPVLDRDGGDRRSPSQHQGESGQAQQGTPRGLTVEHGMHAFIGARPAGACGVCGSDRAAEASGCRR